MAGTARHLMYYIKFTTNNVTRMGGRWFAHPRKNYPRLAWAAANLAMGTRKGEQLT
jgi:hypothetical protein